ncbi:hypothetical protein MC7420_1685 [Coleofasciculus chthonoplastes PCC 7420]|uniref:Uncharacterized protein n=1 Tax=Coleofasciculus chthonoplastes PCC 7420 TaxID=118168 RepID=B4VMM5_9CYAN|nr:hypothetical protein [Coleofasciculus chthonoplastes]EDX76682.1 hypothetical protein MC7420_1685 [Coleofasciculus chthonoplastes PCC 7420]
MAGFMEPVDEVEGDYYDILHYDDGCCDYWVVGHGLESGVVMLMAQTAIKQVGTIEVNGRDRHTHFP